ncbi:MAG: elongation factor P maturation arginine rhamnosyltransferase EarP [Proteobacteria bacterium]|nr:MAG: elongation factor P maturation arginine rhamnosyltransferase EarP [Pseudomonadota bacterium]
MQWDIFCRVVDNFGDIGVSWRLARSLAADAGQAVRLFVDDWSTLRRLLPVAPPVPAPFIAGQVCVLPWALAESSPRVAEVVIEAFACHLPAAYLAAMRAAPRAPVWINLEYLSAEDWIEACHGLPSPDPATGLAKTFFFPGFSAGTGGLIREPGVFVRRDAAQGPTGRADWLAEYPVAGAVASAQWVSLFAYDNPALAGRLADWRQADRQVVLWVPEGTAQRAVAQIIGEPALVSGEVRRLGALTVCALPFLPMETYDRLLALCDVNFVRGEDSFVRAQWAARPFVWQAYPQADAAHLDKLEAFLQRYLDGVDAATAGAVRAFWREWNGDGGATSAWPAFESHWPALARHARLWCDRIGATDGLVERLVKFIVPDVK